MGKSYYTIPKIKRELKRVYRLTRHALHYTIPKIKRELKRLESCRGLYGDYTIPKIKRELKLQQTHFLNFANYTIPKIKRELKLRCRNRYWTRYYTIPKIKRELKHVYVYFRIFSHYTTLYAAYAKPISTFEELQNVNLAPYENYVLTNDIIAGGAQGARIY